MARPTREESLAILERRKNVARRYMRGEYQHEIAAAFEVTQQTISNDLKAIRAEWLDRASSDYGKRKAEELAKIDEVERLAFAAWLKSQENAEVLRAKMRGTGEHASTETEKISKGQAGDPRFLGIILDCIEKRCKILGLIKDADPNMMRGVLQIEEVIVHRASSGMPTSEGGAVGVAGSVPPEQ